MRAVRFLFNDQMARAIVEGRKTVTRRPVDFRKLPHGVVEERHGFGPWPFWEDECGDWHPETRCAPGDLLIGRECWRVCGGYADVRVDYRADGGRMIIGRKSEAVGGALVHYLPDVSKYETSGNRWRPSIHMPDWAARIRRRVLSVTVERVRDITEDDAVREGFAADRHGGTSARNDFLCAWDDIYMNRGFGSAVNPWVWRIEFGAESVEAVK